MCPSHRQHHGQQQTQVLHGAVVLMVAELPVLYLPNRERKNRTHSGAAVIINEKSIRFVLYQH